MDLLEIPDSSIDFEELESAENESIFMAAAVALSSEIMRDYAIIISIRESDALLTRNEAIIYGLVCRSAKLFNSFVKLVCQKDDDGSLFLSRGVMESAVNLMYLIQNRDNAELFDNFIQFSLLTERDALKYLEEEVANNEGALPIEERMISSIKSTFQSSGFSPESIKSASKNTWASISLGAKAKALGFERLNLFGFRNSHHFIHGNWQSLLQQHLTYKEDGTFDYHLDTSSPRPQMILSLQFILCTAAKLFVNYAFEDTSLKEGLIEVFESAIEKRDQIDALHESFLIRHSSN